MSTGGWSGNPTGADESTGDPAEKELGLRRQIDRIFQSVPIEKLDQALLRTLINNTQSNCGFIGYVSGSGSLVVSAVHQMFLKLVDSRGNIVINKEQWLEQWTAALRRREVVVVNEPLENPLDGVRLRNSLVIPIAYREHNLGLVHLGDTESGYTAEVAEMVGAVGTHLAPLVYSRAMWDREMRSRIQTEHDGKSASDRTLLYLAVMSHDVRNQLQGILASTSLLHSLDLEKGQQTLLDAIDQCVGRCVSLISKVEMTEELSSAPLRRRSLVTALKTAVQELSGKYSDVVVEVRYYADNATVRADEFLERLLWNLLENAVIHNPREPRHVWVVLKEENDGYEISVADNGTGIVDEDKTVLFALSRRMHGVGLPQACHLTDKYGGTIEVRDRVENDPAQGADFRLWLPKIST